MREIVYVAGPIGNPDVIGEKAWHENARKLAALGCRLHAHGYCVIVPGFNLLVPGYTKAVPHKLWMEQAEPLVYSCDILVRRGGESPGADQECAWAVQYGKPVMTEQEALARVPLTHTVLTVLGGTL